MRRTKRLVAFSAGLALVAVAAACGDDDDDTGGAATSAAPGTTGGGAETTAPPPTTGAATTTPGSTTPGGTAPGSTTPGTGTSGGSEPPAGGAAMTVTIDINPDAVWEDGSPITWEDFECTYQANLNTPGSLSTTGWDKIASVEAGSSDQQVVVSFKEVYAPYKQLFSAPSGGGLLKKAAVEDCNDVSADFRNNLPISGRPYKIDSWSKDQLILSANENYWGEDKPVTPQVVMVPREDQETEIAALLSGDVDFIYPQFTDTLAASFEGEQGIEPGIQLGTDFEGFYFQSSEGPFADPVYRTAFAKSIDREAVFQQIYQPIFQSAGVEGSLLQCGPITPGPYCFDSFVDNTYDPQGAEQMLTDAGWEKDGQGFWAKDGQAPEIRWMINTGNLRRENTQAYLIPLLQQAGFNVVPDNGSAEEVFQQRLPGLDYDLAMYISTVAPDPQFLTASFTCAQVPSEENNFQGANSTGWCNEEASAALEEADKTVDEAARADLIHQALDLMAEDWAMLPLVQYPRSGFWRTQQVAGPIDQDLINFMAFENVHQWEDVDGDGKVVIGAEQWPGCLNPVTECANSSWYVWTVAFKVLPGVWDTTADGEFVPTNLVTGEPTVETAG
jgi:peptide/nickel transport system substrate-binding protein